MGNIKSVDETNFETEVLQAARPVLVDFWAEWCPPCRKLGPMLEKVAPEIEERLKIVKVNVQEVSSLATRYGVMNIPTMILFKEGAEATRLVGNRTESKLIQDIEPYL